MNFSKVGAMSQVAMVAVVPTTASARAEMETRLGNSVGISRSYSVPNQVEKSGTAIKPEIRGYWDWSLNLKTVETGSPQNRGAWVREAPTVMDRMDLLESRTQDVISALSAKVETLTHAVQSLNNPAQVNNTGYSPPQSANEPFSMSADEAVASGRLAELFNYLADDHRDGSPDLVRAAQKALSDGDSGVRAAAGRALSVMSPKIATELLPALIEGEKHRFVRSILKGALDAARA